MSGNSIGKSFTVTTFGESHGKALGCIIDGCPPGIAISEQDIQVELDKRRPGSNAFTTQRSEKDKVQILSGIFEGKTTGTPIGMIIFNEDQKSEDYDNLKDVFRPSHAGTNEFKLMNIINSNTTNMGAIEGASFIGAISKQAASSVRGLRGNNAVLTDISVSTALFPLRPRTELAACFDIAPIKEAPSIAPILVVLEFIIFINLNSLVPA